MQEKIKIKNSKGQYISAVIHRPKEKTDKLAILCPGFLDTKDYDHLVLLAEELKKNNFTVIRFDPTGTWESGGDISEYLTSQYLNDINSILEFMLKKENYKDILVGGHSRGGMVSILYAARDSRISKVLPIMPSTTHPVTKAIKDRLEKESAQWKKDGFRISSRNIPGKIEKRKFNLPYIHAEDRNQFNVPEDIKKIHAPIIFIVGESDVLCPPEEVKNMFNQANEPKKFVLVPGIGHDYRHSIEEIRKVNEIIINNL